MLNSQGNKDIDVNEHNIGMSDYDRMTEIPDYDNILDRFCERINEIDVPEEHLSSSKKIGTYFEKELRDWFGNETDIDSDGSVAQEEDIPELNLDVKATSKTQPQSSIPMRAPIERIRGMNYDILVFIYDMDKSGDERSVEIEHCSYIPRERTSDHRKSKEARELIEEYENNDISWSELKTNIKELTGVSHLESVEVVTDEQLEELIKNPPKEGAITVSAAAQWRPQYRQVTKDDEDGYEKIY